MKRALHKVRGVLSLNTSIVRLMRRGIERPAGRALLAVVLLAGLVSSGVAMVVRVHGSPAAVTAGTSNLRAWGLNGDGELGVTTSQTCSGYVCSAAPISVTSIGTVTAVAGGSGHTLAVASDGSVWAWGRNESGQLGNPSVSVCTYCQSTTPVQVSGLPGPVVAVSAGFEHSLALTSSGAVYAWGSNGQGELGDGTTTNRNSAVPVTGLPANIVAIAAGGWHSLALTSSWTVYAWGDNTYGELGDGTTTDQFTPEALSGLPTITAISAHAFNGMALASTGVVYDWGDNRFGQLGDATTSQSNSPVTVSGLTGVQAIAQGGGQGLALTSTGAVYAWGDNDFGELGVTVTTACPYEYYCSTTPVLVPGLPAGITAIAAGGGSNMALSASGMVWTWGENSLGQLGVGGNNADTVNPVPAPATGLTGVTAIVSGDAHALAIATPPATPPSYGAASLSGNYFNLGNQQVGGTSSVFTYTLLNAGTAPLTISGVMLGGQNPGDFSLTANTCVNPQSTILQPGASCSVGVTFTPAATGTRSTLLSVACDGVNCPLSPTMLATGINPIAGVSPMSVDFGTQPLGTNASQTVTLSNVGTTPLVVQSIGAASSSFAVRSPTSSFTVAPGASVPVTVVFVTGGPAGPRSATLTFYDNDTLHPHTVALSGTVASYATISPTSLSFGNQAVGTTSAPQTVTITNAGSSQVTVTAISSSDPTDFVFTSAPLPITLAANASATVSVTFSPSSAGARSGTLSITSTGTAYAQTVALSGTGTQSADLGVTLSAGPNPVRSGSSLTYTIMVANHGPTAASGMVVSEAVPAGTTFASVTATLGSCTGPGVGGTGTVTCSAATLGNVKVTAPNGSTVTGTASVSAGSPDPNSANNTATVSTSVSKH